MKKVTVDAVEMADEENARVMNEDGTSDAMETMQMTRESLTQLQVQEDEMNQMAGKMVEHVTVGSV